VAIFLKFAAINDMATKTLWAAMPRTRRRPGSARASWAVSLAKPFSPSIVLR
jgi:hypothetical protein